MKEEKSKYKQDPRAMYIVSMAVFGTIGLFVSVLLLGGENDAASGDGGMPGPRFYAVE